MYGYGGCCPVPPCGGYGYGYAGGSRNWFALIIVLFILLVIIGASWAY